MVNKETGEPVAIYVDTDTKDIIYGKTGEVINNHVIKTEDGKSSYAAGDNDPDSYKKDDDYKKKVEKDGDIKIKDDDSKMKVDGDNGDKKVKKD